MSESEPSHGTDSGGELNRFSEDVEALTGRNPNMGSFLLTVGSVTCVFIALFQFTLPSSVGFLLTGGVLIITVLSGVFALILDTLGYFG
ncbi:hypothetical protein [Halococcus qingdaonensis]|uniref:hypothetical protein n=1 Tax=Halococcus qingdaonensis TaxID=224402 RepID=UPI002115F782|nr:hypothetical protein [Halococcus qingdaonensis]